MTLWTTFALLLVAIATGLYVFQALLSVGAMNRARRAPPLPVPMHRPLVSVLKPLAGLDDELRDNLETFVGQRAVRYELLLGVASLDDPAVPVAQAFVADHPELDARIVLTCPNAGLNPKAAQLVGLEAQARGEIIVVSDSNVRVRPDYLRNLVGRLAEPDMGVVSNVIAGTGEQTFGSHLENLMIAAFQAPGVIGGYELTGGGAFAITIGKSMAMRRSVLEQIGGFARYRNVLAEDQAIGKAVQALGYQVAINHDTVENRNVSGSFRQTFRRHTRWARTRRSIFPSGYLIEPVLVPLFWATLALALAPGWHTATVFAGLWFVQMAGDQAYLVATRRQGMSPRWLLLEFLRVPLYAVAWLSGWSGRHVTWRGHELQIGRGGELGAGSEAARQAMAQAERRQPVDVTARLVPQRARKVRSR